MAREEKYGKVTFEHGDIPDDELVFVLRAQDILAPATVAFYAMLRETTVGCFKGQNIGLRIRSIADEMAKHPRRKMPD
ncbi:MAG: hypothetical protein UY48_C0003G0026 [Candidatus Gottesmanbacteria bacterium GW2011_GWB1_49_7]|uniref:Uncharacterized protein n=1 Tax=Candidatus Gottesmanbacteria bacterium GW2011_GWB1_49_7 TaxID=1618448 RepID=A0A0G1Z360_9BACT|nr:MAG: hypothetical protein UY48_C0003G0026 [Candidatus Gottesmanbacteria bacterium GW2011_GWB1_49_7]